MNWKMVTGDDGKQYLETDVVAVVPAGPNAPKWLTDLTDAVNSFTLTPDYGTPQIPIRPDTEAYTLDVLNKMRSDFPRAGYGPDDDTALGPGWASTYRGSGMGMTSGVAERNTGIQPVNPQWVDVNPTTDTSRFTAASSRTDSILGTISGIPFAASAAVPSGMFLAVRSPSGWLDANPSFGLNRWIDPPSELNRWTDSPSEPPAPTGRFHNLDWD